MIFYKLGIIPIFRFVTVIHINIKWQNVMDLIEFDNNVKNLLYFS